MWKILIYKYDKTYKQTLITDPILINRGQVHLKTASKSIYSIELQTFFDDSHTGLHPCETCNIFL